MSKHSKIVYTDVIVIGEYCVIMPSLFSDACSFKYIQLHQGGVQRSRRTDKKSNIGVFSKFTLVLALLAFAKIVTCITRTLKHSDTSDALFVAGNGPSGISLSYLLAGNWPYYTGEIHPNEYLQLRLQDGGDASLVEQVQNNVVMSCFPLTSFVFGQKRKRVRA